MPKITVKTEYIDKLKQLGVYDAWLANLKNETISPADEKDMYEAIDFQTLIKASFIWTDATEGFDFWAEISDK